ncbi:MAG: acyl-CoA thioesterase II [Acidimicrobiia bacterium]|nr:acyl-CoA thioesterase II [Acidimicrobiia bacterium]
MPVQHHAADQRDVDAIVTSLDLEEIDRNLYRGHPPYWERGRLFGGIVAAQALAAAYGTIDGIHVHSLHSYFLRPGDPDMPVVYDVDCIRDGRSFATRRVVARQKGEAIYNLSASFHKVEDGFDHQAQMPDVPGPDDSPLPEDFGLTPRDYLPSYWALEGVPMGIRHLHGPDEWVPGVLHRNVWLRANGSLPDDPIVHRLMLTYLSDLSLLGTAVRMHTPGFDKIMAASLDHSIWFHREFRADEWLLYAMTSPSASGARGFNVGHFFTEDGVLVASATQEGLMRNLAD